MVKSRTLKNLIKLLSKFWFETKTFLAIFLPGSSSPHKGANLTIFVFLRDSANQKNYMIFMRFFRVSCLNIKSNFNFGQNRRSLSYKFGQIWAEKFQNFKSDKIHENFWYDAKNFIVLHKSPEPGQILA